MCSSTCVNQGLTSLQLNYPQHKTENSSVELLVKAVTVGQPSFLNNEGQGLQPGSWHCCLCPGFLRINRGPCSSNLSHKINIFFLDLTGNAWACSCLRSGLQHCSSYLPHSLEFQSHPWSNLLGYLFYDPYIHLVAIAMPIVTDMFSMTFFMHSTIAITNVA